MRIAPNIKFFFSEILNLVKTPVFVLLTVLGNGLIGVFGYVFYLVEHPVNPKVQHFLDALWWSFSTATTTGYGDITPVTHTGKILGICLMLIGTAIFAIYTGLFAETILSSEKVRRRH